MKFKKLAYTNYEGSCCPKGDFLTDAKRDPNFPWDKSFDEQIGYLIGLNACTGAFSALEEMQQEYNKSQTDSEAN